MFNFKFNEYELRLILESLNDFRLYVNASTNVHKDILSDDLGKLINEIEKKIKV